MRTITYPLRIDWPVYRALKAEAAANDRTAAAHIRRVLRQYAEENNLISKDQPEKSPQPSAVEQA
jgi:hypothetical protein